MHSGLSVGVVIPCDKEESGIRQALGRMPPEADEEENIPRGARLGEVGLERWRDGRNDPVALFAKRLAG